MSTFSRSRLLRSLIAGSAVATLAIGCDGAARKASSAASSARAPVAESS